MSRRASHPSIILAAGLAGLLCSAPPAAAAQAQRLDFPLRGKVLTLAVYKPQATSQGTIVMGSGDVGWVGLAVDMSEYLSDRGFTVIGVNVRQYLGAFTDGKKTLTTAEAPS